MRASIFTRSTPATIWHRLRAHSRARLNLHAPVQQHRGALLPRRAFAVTATAATAIALLAVGPPAGAAPLMHAGGRILPRAAPESALLDYQFLGVAATPGSNGNGIWAVGETGTYHTLAKHWNGTRWTQVPTPDSDTSGPYGQLRAVAAVSASNAWAVGYDGSTLDEDSPLAAWWNGKKWEQVTTPVPSGAVTTHLYAVTAVSAHDVWAIGYSYNGTAYSTLTENWNGKAWKIIASPTPDPSGYAALNGVVAVSATDVWAVGNSSTAGTLTEQWNGKTWTVVPSPNPAGVTSAQLHAVAAVSATDVWAVGQDSAGTLTEQWNGKTWTVLPGPRPNGPDTPMLTGVAAVSATDVWAVGDSSAGGTLTENWNGTTWKVVPSPTPRGGDSYSSLNGVTAVSATNVWAAGNDFNLPSGTLTEQWTGTKWELVHS
jgi:hypothetical protein